MNSCPWSRRCHLAISSSVVPFSSCLQSFPALGSFPVSQFFTSGGQKYWSFSISPSNEYSVLISFRTDWFDLFAVPGISRVFSNTTIQKQHSSVLSLLCGPTLISVHDYWKNHSFDYIDLCQQSDVSAFYCGRAIIINMTSVCQACALQMDMP